MSKSQIKRIAALGGFQEWNDMTDTQRLVSWREACDEIVALRAEWDALRAERDKLAGLVDSWRPLLDACAPYLKDGETPAERIERERKDLTATVGMLANERRRAEDLFQQCRLGFEYREELRARVAELESAALAVLGCNDRCCIQSPQCPAQCQADEKLRRLVQSAGAVPE